MLKKLGGISVIFGVGVYYLYQKMSPDMNFQPEVFEKMSIKDKKMHLYKCHQLLAFTIDDAFNRSESEFNIKKIKEVLLSHANGFVLETGVGTSRNIDYYPEGLNIIGVDWSSNMIEKALRKPIFKNIKIDYKIEDCEQLSRSFEENTFDTIIDTFGLEYYLNPLKVLNEMKKVCKNNGKILILANGLSDNIKENMLIQAKTNDYLKKYGCFLNRDWNEIIKNSGLLIESFENINNTLYFYVLINKKN